MNKLCLGTASFGLDYGINNHTGKFSKDLVDSVMLFAEKHGIEYLDTASAYGNAEEVLGDHFKYYKNADYFKVITKLKPEVDAIDIRGVRNEIFKELTESLKRLGISKLDGYLIHNAKHFYREDIMSCLKLFKKEGLITKIGVSIYKPEDALVVCQDDTIDYIQIPFNVFDHRLDSNGFFESTQNRNIKVFARSAYLQGLVMMDERAVPDYLEDAKPILKRFNDIATRHGMDRSELAVQYVYFHKNIDYWVFSVDNLNQLKENLNIVMNKTINDDIINELKEAFSSVDERILMPNLWR